MSSIRDCKTKLPLPALWRALWPAAEGPHEGRVSQMVRAAWREERSGSVSVKSDAGGWRWYDHGDKQGGDEIHLIMLARACDRREAIKIYHELAGVQPEAREKKPVSGWLKDSKLVATYDYRTVDGALVFEKLRFEPGPDGAKKTFLVRRPAREGMAQGQKIAKRDPRTGKWWLWTREGLPPMLYRMEEWHARPDRRLWVVEGEKDADTLRGLGELATTAPDGAGKWTDEFSQQLRGRRVLLCGDSDAKGVEHVLLVGERLAAAGCDVQVVDWQRLGVAPGEKCDATDFLQAESQEEKNL